MLVCVSGGPLCSLLYGIYHVTRQHCRYPHPFLRSRVTAPVVIFYLLIRGWEDSVQPGIYQCTG